MEKILCTTYGDCDANRGIAVITNEGDFYSLDYLKLPGKCNFAIEFEDILYVPVQADKNLMMEFSKYGSNYILNGTFEVKHFYSNGVVYQNQLLFSSFADGVDAIYDLFTHQEKDIYTHKRRNYQSKGRSHYIGLTLDGRYVYSVDNELQQIYMYKIENNKFKVINTKEFAEEKIRLMPYSIYSGKAYLNTEKTNRIYILDFYDGDFHIQDVENMESTSASFSGANSISADGEYMCVGLRGDNILQYYRIRKDGSLKLLTRASCGKMPRDILFENDKIYVTCTDQNMIEVYDTKNEILKKVSEIKVTKPVTFAKI